MAVPGTIPGRQTGENPFSMFDAKNWRMTRFPNWWWRRSGCSCHLFPEANTHQPFFRLLILRFLVLDRIPASFGSPAGAMGFPVFYFQVIEMSSRQGLYRNGQHIMVRRNGDNSLVDRVYVHHVENTGLSCPVLIVMVASCRAAENSVYRFADRPLAFSILPLLCLAELHIPRR